MKVQTRATLEQQMIPIKNEKIPHNKKIHDHKDPKTPFNEFIRLICLGFRLSFHDARSIV